jgi:hypothetical protein
MIGGLLLRSRLLVHTRTSETLSRLGRAEQVIEAKP